MDKKNFKALSILAIQHLLTEKLILLNTTGFLRFRKFDISLNKYYELKKEELIKID